MEMTRENARSGSGAQVIGPKFSGAQGGLAGWLMELFSVPLRVRFAGMGKARTKRRMELVEMLQLGGKRQLMLVVCDGQRYLVGAGGDSVQSIAEMRGPLTSDLSLAASEGIEADGVKVARPSSAEEVPCCS